MTVENMPGNARFGVVAMIGGGKMGEAIAGGLVDAGTLGNSQIIVAEPDAERRTELIDRYPFMCVARNSQALLDASMAILAVKPQVLEQVVRDVASELSGTLVVSIAAGFSTARIESLLPAGSRVVRVMPNTPALVGEGMALVCGGSEASEDDVALVADLFASIGEAQVIDEKLMDAATAISGSGPAYFALVIDALARAGVAEGLPRPVAQDLAVQTMRGTAALLSETGMHPEELIDGVASPGGTTIAALERLEAGAVRASFAAAVAAAVRRAHELGA
ncbi:MAG: pyrroline-5-carboxylate reductase [Coriobacteriia bacterium]|nr:pyrroline-5-carboxylate reductase [Coriobacteriia bacterium]